MEDSVLFLGKFDNKLLEFEEKIIKNLEELLKGRSDFHLVYDEPKFPDVIKYQVGNCKMWPILGDVKSNLLLKDLISKTKVVLFIFNLTNLETLEFLREGWGPIIKKVNQNKSNDQTCILIGTQSEPNNYTDNLSDKISSTMELLNCCAYFKEEINNKPTRKEETIGRYPILPNLITLIHFIKDQISTEFTKSHKDIDKLNENKETEKEGESFNNNDEDKKVIVNFKDKMICNLFTKNQTAEIVKIQNIGGSFRIPASVNYRKKDYKITSICDHALENSIITGLSFDENSEIKRIGDYAFQKSKIQQLFIPSSLVQLGKYWCAGANELLKIEVDKSNKHFSMLNEFLIFKNGSTSEILFAPPNTEDKFSIQKDFCIGNYAFSNNKGLQRLVSRVSLQHLDIGDYSFYGAQDLQDVTLDSKELNIGDCCFQRSPKLQSIKITSNKLNIGNGSFVNCTSLKTANFDKIETAKISPNAFFGCESLEEFKITSSSLEIGKQCFFNAINLKEIEIIGKESLIIGESCFENCTSLSSILLENENDPNMKIPENAFNGCQSLTKITIKCNSTMKLNKGLFQLTNKLETFSITCNEIIIGNQFFSNCFNRQSRIYIKSKNKIEFEDHCFESSNIKQVEIEGKELIFLNECFKNCIYLKTIQISNASQIFIDEFSFIGCTSLINISLKNIEYIKILPNAFDRCNKLQEIELESTSKIDINQFCFCNLHNFESVIIMNNGIFTFDLFFKINSSSISFCENKCSEKQYKYKSFVRYKHRPKLTIETRNYYYFDTFESINNYYSNENETLFTKDKKPELADAHSINSHASEIVKTNDYSDEDDIFLAKEEKYEQINYKGIIYNYSINSQTAEIVKAQNVIDNYIVPQFINISNKGKFTITKICDNAFEKSSIKSLSFEKNSEIRTIGNYAFIHSPNLQKVILESKEINIGERCFSNLNKLQKVELIGKESLNIGERCFENCTSLSSISFINKSDKNMIISKDIFSCCKSLKSITFGSHSTINLNNESFADNNKLETVSIVGKEIIIGNKCFFGCFNKEKYEYIYRSKYGYSKYDYSKILIEKSLVIKSESKIELGNNCFENSYIEDINIDGKELNIKKNCFKNCECLKVFQISNIPQISINEYSFNMCQKLKRISFEKVDDITIESNAFSQCDLLETIDIKSKSRTYIDNNSFSNLKNLHTISITCEDIYIGESCFQNYINLSAISFYDVKTITLGKNAFLGCSKLQDFRINSIFKNNKQYIEFSTATIEQIYIGESCFQNCVNIPTISFYNVKNIKLCKNAFSECAKLKTFSINSLLKNNYYATNKYIEFSSVDTEQIYIGESCFQNCYQLSSILFSHASQIKLLPNAFLGCQSLKEFKLTSSKLIIGNNCFSGAAGLRIIELICQNGLIIGESCFENCTSLSSILLQNESEKDMIISNNAFNGCNSITSITIKNKIIQKFSQELFPKPNKIKKLTIIGDEVFINDNFFEEFFDNHFTLIIESKNKIELGNNCFENSFIEKAEIKGEELIIKKESFKNCSHLETILISDTTRIFLDEYSFSGCDYLSSVSLKNIGYISIQSNSFYECKRLNNIELQLSREFDVQNYFEVSDEYPNKSFKLRDKKTDKFLLAKSLGYQYNQIKSINQIIPLLKENNTAMPSFYAFCLFHHGSDSFYSILTEFYENGTLEDAFKSEILNGTQRHIILLGLTLGMQYLNSKNINSQDLTPSQIFLDDLYYPKLNNIKISNSTTYMSSCILGSEFNSFIPIMYELVAGGSSNKYYRKRDTHQSIQFNNDDALNEQIKNFLMSLNNHRLNFKMIFDAITKDYFFKFFKSNEKEVINYAYLFGIELKEDFNYEGINYTLYKRCQIADIVKAKEVNEIFKIPKYIPHNGNQYNITKICDEACDNLRIKFISFAKDSLVTSIGNYAFTRTNLTVISIPASIEKIGSFCFSGLKNIKNIYFECSTLTIGERCFEGCTSLASISFPKTKIVKIESNCFHGCTNLTKISTMKKSNIELGESCFSGLENLSTIDFQCESLNIGNECFNKCTKLSSFAFINAQNISIGSKCFKDCINIHEIDFRCQKITINSNCFENCKCLKSFKCETSDLTIYQQIFNGCDKLENISITQGQSNVIENEMQNNELVLSKNLFSNLNSLKTFNIETNQSIIIKSNPFYRCKSLSKVRFKSMHSVVFKAKSFYQVNIKSFEVTGNKVEFGESCFSYSNGLQSMKITCDELSIAINCFNSCSELSSISFENLKCAKIDMYSFYYCNKLIVLELSTSTSLEINRSSFYNLKGLKKISLTTRNLIILNQSNIYNFNKSNEKDVNKISLNGLHKHCNLHIHLI